MVDKNPDFSSQADPREVVVIEDGPLTSDQAAAPQPGQTAGEQVQWIRSPYLTGDGA